MSQNNEDLSVRSKMRQFGLDIFRPTDLVKTARNLEVNKAVKTLSQSVQSNLKSSKK